MKIKLLRTPRLALTLGEPAGIGPDLCYLLAQQSLPAEVVVIGCAQTLLTRAKSNGIHLQLNEFNPQCSPKANGSQRLSIIDIPVTQPVFAGQLNAANNDYVLKTLQRGYEVCAQGECDALVTLPVHKAIITQSGGDFTGHTEFFAQLAGVSDVLMTFYSPKFILGQVTTHCALTDVSRRITKQRLSRCIELLQTGLTDVFDRPKPRIDVLGLNPHAGENGTLGQEEIQVITPVVKTMQQRGFNVRGPMSADTAFIPSRLEQLDAILAMYHDQGLCPLKALSFGQIVNITLGLPFLRASVDHGTALDLAGTTRGSISSLQVAIQAAADFAFMQAKTPLHFHDSATLA